jgi:hypothetical protein
VDSEEELKKLKEIPFENLKPNFKLEFINLKNKIYKDTEPKIINSKRITGPVLANLIEEFVNAINKGIVPNINNAWDNVINKDISDFKRKALEKYKSNTKQINELQENEELMVKLQQYKNEALLIYDKFLLLNANSLSNKQYSKWYLISKDSLEDDIRRIENNILRDNNEKAHKLNQQVLRREYKDITEYMFKTNYNKESINKLIESIKR